MSNGFRLCEWLPALTIWKHWMGVAGSANQALQEMTWQNWSCKHSVKIQDIWIGEIMLTEQQVS